MPPFEPPGRAPSPNLDLPSDLMNSANKLDIARTT